MMLNRYECPYCHQMILEQIFVLHTDLCEYKLLHKSWQPLTFAEYRKQSDQRLVRQDSREVQEFAALVKGARR